MRLQTGLRRVFALIALSVGTIPASAQGLSSSNPLEYAAIAGGEELLGNQIKKQSKAMAAIAVEQGAMTVANTKMKQWEQKYNSYLKTASGYASAIKAAPFMPTGCRRSRHYGKSIRHVESIPKELLLPYR